jgi:hypothetical protein
MFINIRYLQKKFIRLFLSFSFSLSFMFLLTRVYMCSLSTIKEKMLTDIKAANQVKQKSQEKHICCYFCLFLDKKYIYRWMIYYMKHSILMLILMQH